MNYPVKLSAIFWLALPALAQTLPPSTEIARVLLGVAQTGTPQTQATQHLFADLSFLRPLPVAKLSVWGNVRLASSPRPINSTILTLATDTAKSVLATPLYQLAQSGEFVTGLDYTLAAANSKANISAIGAFGATAQLASSSTSQPSRFPRQYWGGVRFSSPAGTPHVLDLMAGQNELITGGLLHGPVARVHAEFGLVVPKLGTVYLLGDVQLAAARGPQQTDLYRMGIGFDFLQMLKASGSN